MSYISYHNFMEIESKTKKLTEEEANMLYGVLKGYEEIHAEGMFDEEFIEEFNKFKQHMDNAINGCAEAQQNMLKAAELIKPSLPQDMRKKMDVVIGDSITIDGYNLRIYNDIKTRLAALKFSI